MALSNFGFYRCRCLQRWMRRDRLNESFFFICYIFYKDGSFGTVRNNQATLNGIIEDDILYFEGIWEDRYNYRYNDDDDDGLLMKANRSVPRHTRVHHNDDGEMYSAVCECDACKSGSFDNGFFFITSNTVRKCQHGDEDICPCEDIMCPDCSCVTLDAGMEFLRVIGVQGLSSWYDNRYKAFDDRLKELNLTSDEYEASIKDEVKVIGEECNAFIVKLEAAIKCDYERFYAMREATCSVCGRPYGSMHRTSTACRICGSALNQAHTTGANGCASLNGWTGTDIPSQTLRCANRGGWTGRVMILHTERPFEDVKNNMSTYRYEGHVKDRYESFLYEWRQVVVQFRLKYEIDYEYDV